MSKKGWVAVAGIAAAAVLAAGVATLALGAAQSAAGSCVTARAPYLSSDSLLARATQACGGEGKTYVFLQAHYGRQKHVYTLASGSTTGSLVEIGATRCPASGMWHTWTFAMRDDKTNTSRTVSYSCGTGTSGFKLAR